MSLTDDLPTISALPRMLGDMTRTRAVTRQQQWTRLRKESTRSMERRRAVVGRRLSQRLARLSLPLRRGQGRDPA